MKYLYEESLNGLKDLKHIEWFLNHHSDYEFKTYLIPYYIKYRKKMSFILRLLKNIIN
jgi:hypothetical protein